MKNVTMYTIYAGDNGTANPGDKILVSDKEADDLIKGGYAKLTPKPAPSKKPSAEESAKAKLAAKKNKKGGRETATRNVTENASKGKASKK